MNSIIRKSLTILAIITTLGVECFAAEPEVVKPEMIEEPTPLYPTSEIEKGTTARVVLEFKVTWSGKIKKLKIYSSTNEVFNEAAILTMKKAKFKPGTVDGKPADFTLRLPIEFAPPTKQG